MMLLQEYRFETNRPEIEASLYATRGLLEEELVSPSIFSDGGSDCRIDGP